MIRHILVHFPPVPDKVEFVDIDHQTWQGHYQEALAMGFGDTKAREFANWKCRGAR